MTRLHQRLTIPLLASCLLAGCAADAGVGRRVRTAPSLVLAGPALDQTADPAFDRNDAGLGRVRVPYLPTIEVSETVTYQRLRISNGRPREHSRFTTWTYRLDGPR